MLMSLWACSSDYDANGTDAVTAPVYLSASIGGEEVHSRVSYDNPDSIPSEQYPFTAIIFASTTAASYNWNGTDMDASADNTISYCDKSVTFTSGDPVLLAEPIKWPSGDADLPVYFTGLYPANTSSLWTSIGDNNASCTVDGKTDILTAAESIGSYSEHAAKSEAVLHFHHKLCKLRFNICSESEKVMAAWGRLLKIELIGQKTKITTTLSDGSATFDYANASATDDEAESNILPLYHIGTDDKFVLSYYKSDNPADIITQVYYDELSESEQDAYTPNISEMANIPNNATEVAYVLCPPMEIGRTTNADGETVPDKYYTVNVYTDGGVVSFLKLNLSDELGNTFYGNTAGKEFIITLDFVIGNKIYSSSAKVTPWVNGGQTEIHIEE